MPTSPRAFMTPTSPHAFMLIYRTDVCISPQLVEKLFWDAEGGVPYKIIYEE